MDADLRIMKLYKKRTISFYCENICVLHADCKGLEFELSSHKQHPLWQIMEDRHPSSITLLGICKDIH